MGRKLRAVAFNRNHITRKIGQGGAWAWAGQDEPGLGLSSWDSTPREVEAKQQGAWDKCFYLVQ